MGERLGLKEALSRLVGEVVSLWMRNLEGTNSGRLNYASFV